MKMITSVSRWVCFISLNFMAFIIVNDAIGWKLLADHYLELGLWSACISAIVLSLISIGLWYAKTSRIAAILSGLFFIKVMTSNLLIHYKKLELTNLTGFFWWVEFNHLLIPFSLVIAGLIILSFVIFLFNRQLRFASSVTWLLLGSAVSIGLIFYFFYTGTRREPMVDFLPLAKGDDVALQIKIPKGEKGDSINIKMFYTIDGVVKSYWANQIPSNVDPTLFDSVKKEIIISGARPAVEDFYIFSDGNALVDSVFFQQKGYRFIIIQKNLEEADTSTQTKLSNLAVKLDERNDMHIWAITSGRPVLTALYAENNGVPYDYYFADKGVLDCFCRGNQAVVLLKGNKILRKWSGASLPSAEKVLALMP